ncbi:MAG: hypothetical protein WCY51_02775 [Sulfurimonas sp.]|uniref:hypothetical protein n=1 Tax=Sulfurimonas sp. TaxID=2022749 RepID=UPI0025D4BA94|nr:hypothetical protein [Sulfurimonas sp.]MCK9454497.1 hypothetical protein [Sulfurimonas sp.]
MSEGLEKLKSIGIQKVHEVTHISRVHVQAIFNENFEGMGSVQLLGFISILEREYSVDLSELKSKAKEYFESNAPVEENIEKVKLFSSSKKERNPAFVYGVIALIIILTLLYFASRAPQSDMLEDNTTSQAATIVIQDDENVSEFDENITEESLLEPTLEKEQEIEVKPITLKIIPKTRVWLGYIDLSNHKKYQKIFSDELEFDTTKDWLLAFGHGHIDIDINGEIKSFQDPKNIRFSYIDSELKEISFEEFKSLNRGSGW